MPRDTLTDHEQAACLVQHIRRGLHASGATTHGGLCEDLKSARLTALAAVAFLAKFEAHLPERSIAMDLLSTAADLMRYMDDPRAQIRALALLRDEIAGAVDNLEYDAVQARREPAYPKHTAREMV